MSDNKDCSWIEDDDGAWETKCNEKFEFNDGGPSENGFLFCPYCGKKLKPKTSGKKGETNETVRR